MKGMMSLQWFPIEREYLVPHGRNMIKKDADWNPRRDGTPLLRLTVVANLDELGCPIGAWHSARTRQHRRTEGTRHRTRWGRV